MEQQNKKPIEAEEIKLDIPQDVSQDLNADALQKLKDLFPAGSQFNITKDSTEGSEADFSVEITVGDNKYSGLCSKDGTPIEEWKLERGKELEIKITFQEKSDLFKITVQSQEELATFQTESGGQFIDGSGQLVLGSGKFTDGLYKDDKYNGEFLDNKLHGKGKCTFADGSIYEGDWQDNKLHGKGKRTFAGGSIYEGDWQDNKFHGKGTYTFADGEKYEGDWQDDKKHGKGTYTLADGEKYDGCWQDGKLDGKGIYTWKNGNIYDGDWKDNQKHGKGIFTYPDGSIYEGDWKDGQRHGRGIFTYPDGEKYEGDWQDDKKHGKGKHTEVDGSIYEGDWKDGKKHGKGIYTYPDGSIYEGDWKDNKLNGKGKRTFADGSIYEGDWKDNQRHGKGICTYPDGSIYEGDWKDDKMMTSSNKPKEKNEIDTLELRSKEIDEENRALKYKNDKFLLGGKPVEVAVCENSAGALAAIEKFIKNKKNITEENSKCRIVFNQHGNATGLNDMSIDSESAKKILKILVDARFTEIKISDLACKGGTAHHFLEVAQDVANEHGVVIGVRSAPKDRTCVGGIKVSKTDGGKRLAIVTLGTDGSGKSRELKVFTPESANVGNPELTNLKCKEEEKSSKSI